MNLAEFEWPTELVDAVTKNAAVLGAATNRVIDSGVSDHPILIAYLDGVDSYPVVLAASAATNGWNFAITHVEEMVARGSVSEQAGGMMKMGGKSKDDFKVFNVEIPKINVRRFPIP